MRRIIIGDLEIGERVRFGEGKPMFVITGKCGNSIVLRQIGNSCESTVGRNSTVCYAERVAAEWGSSGEAAGNELDPAARSNDMRGTFDAT